MTWAARIPQLSGGSSALADLNFATNVYALGSSHSSNPANLPGWSFTRVSVGTAQDSSGSVLSFLSGVPRITDLGLLVEESRTNLALHSQDVSMLPIVSSVTITGGAGSAPDGTNTVTSVSRPAVVGDDRGQQNITVANNSATYAVSLFVRKGPNQTTELMAAFVGGTGVSALLDFNPSTGVISASTGATAPAAQSRGSWWQISFCLANNSTGNTTLAIQLRPNTGGTGAVDVWGLQVEAGAFPTSYIPTTSAPATRAADVVSIGGLSATANWSLLAVGSRATALGFSATASLNDGTTNNEAYVVSNDPGFSGLQAEFNTKIGGGATVSASIGPTVIGTPAKMALSATGTAVNAALNGGATSPITMAGTLPFTTLSIGQRAGSILPLNGVIQKVVVYSTAINAQAATQ